MKKRKGNSAGRKNRAVRAAAVLCILVISLLPVVSYGDAVVESFWAIAFETDYNIEVTAPDGGVNLRIGAGTQYDILLDHLIPNGTQLHVNYETKADNGKPWGHVTYQGAEGWVFLGHCTKLSSSQQQTQVQQPEPEDTSSQAAVQQQPAPQPQPEPQPQPQPETQDNGVMEISEPAGDQASEDSVTAMPGYYTPLMLIAAGLLIIVAVLGAILLLRRSRDRGDMQ